MSRKILTECKHAVPQNPTIYIAECPLTQSEIDYIGDNLDILVKTVDNLADDGEKHRVRFTLHNTGNETIRGRDWQLYFHSFFMVEPETLLENNEFIDKDYMIKISHVSGSLYKLEPLPGFTEIRPGGKRTLEFDAKYWAVSATDYSPNWYITSPKLQPRVIKSTTDDAPGSKRYVNRDKLNPKFVDEFSTVKQWKRYRHDEMNPFTPQDRYERYNLEENEPGTRSVIPTPKKVIEEPYSSINFGQGTWRIVADSRLTDEATILSGNKTQYIWTGKRNQINRCHQPARSTCTYIVKKICLLCLQLQNQDL